MSGPKSFSVNIFNSKLKEIFSIQSKINQLFNELGKYSVLDKELSIYFDCQDFIQGNEEALDKHLQTFEIGRTGTVEQAEYNTINKRIENKLEKLKKFHKKVRDEKNNFMDKRQDYLSYTSYLNYYEKSHNSFTQFKQELTNYLEKNIKAEKPKLFEESKEQISSIEPSIKKQNFEFGFRNKEQKNKQKVTEHIDEKENKASEVRNKIAKDMLAKSFKQKTTSPEQIEEEKEIAGLIQTIENKIDLIENNQQSEKLKAEFNKLKKSEVLKGAYFYKEFLDNLSQAEKTEEYKKEIKELLYQLNTIEIANNLQEKKNELQQYAVELLELESIKQYKIEDYKTQCHFFKEENKHQVEDKFAKQKANEFLKAQLVKGLQNMNYQVMDDMEVIDFEKQSDFLFKVPEQDNYVNLRINEDNNIAYNFLIEENKNELSLDEKKEKVIEMEQTCKSFKDVLKDLEKMGLDINQTKAGKADTETLMQVPEKYQDKIKAVELQRQQIEELKPQKRYLDDN